jgi:flavin reductase (DIM6/NTAB) family NADH-FMN oxidoreductase RutF
VYVVGAAQDERRDAFTAAWVMQTSFDPLLLALSINPQNASYPLLRASRAFTISVLKRGRGESRTSSRASTGTLGAAGRRSWMRRWRTSTVS